jgi:hypothetical protein
MAARNPALAPLDVLVGERSMVAGFEGMPIPDVGARVVFECLPGEQFPEAPDSITIIGLDLAGGGRYLEHYFDSRCVARIYKMTLEADTWTLWRDEADLSALDFRQRYIGTIAGDSQTIAGAWEICHEGSTWEHDFNLSYRKL